MIEDDISERNQLGGRKTELRISHTETDQALGRSEKNDLICKEYIVNAFEIDQKLLLNGLELLLGEHSRKESLRIIAKLFDCGAKKIYAGHIDRNETEATCGHLVVVLPNEQRDEIISIIDVLAQKLGYDSDGDFGQSLSFIKLD